MFPLALLSPALFSNPSTLTETVVSDVYFFAFTSLLNKVNTHTHSLSQQPIMICKSVHGTQITLNLLSPVQAIVAYIILMLTINLMFYCITFSI
uniref:Uncharacterized protein n=1 Tax=Rhizophora mucronata TaxID=61149 RepID=A0A2P2JRH3_RHIMU